MKMRSLAVGLSLLTAGTVFGVTTQQFASADVSTGDRPVLVPIEPCRLVDTRPGAATVGPRSSRIGAANTLTVDAQEPATRCTGLIPTDALSLALNVTAIGATEQTFLTIWAGGDRPLSSSLNPAPGQPPTPNAVTVDLSIDQEFEIYNDLGTLNLVVDVTGYYADHVHDDRYYTKAETDSSKTQRVTISAAAFQPSGDAITGFAVDDIYGTYATGSPGRVGFSAPVTLPIGTLITSVTWYYRDNSATSEIRLSMASTSLEEFSQGSFGNAFTHTSSGAVDSVRTATLTSSPGMAVTDVVTPSLSAFSTAWQPTLSIKGAVIEYILP